MRLSRSLQSIVLGAALALPSLSSFAQNILYPVDGFQIKSSAGPTNSQRPHINIEFIVDHIPEDKASTQFYSGTFDKSAILFKTQEKVAQFFTEHGIDVSISARKGQVTPLSTDPQEAVRSFDGTIRVYYMGNAALKKFYDQDPRRYFIDVERPTWLSEYYTINLKKMQSFAGFLGSDGIEAAMKKNLADKLDDDWNLQYRAEVSGGLAATTTKRAFIYPLAPVFEKAIKDDAERANVLSVLEIHEILHDLGEEDSINTTFPNIMSPGSYVNTSGRDEREKLELFLTGQIKLFQWQLDRIPSQIKRLECYGCGNQLLLRP
jgi:hypothetical protein